MGLHEVQENVVLWRDYYEIRICMYIVRDVPKRFHAKGRGVICIRSCPEAEFEGLDADIADLEDIAIIKDPGVDVEGPEANL
jgi:hypothetical protein